MLCTARRSKACGPQSPFGDMMQTDSSASVVQTLRCCQLFIFLLLLFQAERLILWVWSIMWHIGDSNYIFPLLFLWQLCHNEWNLHAPFLFIFSKRSGFMTYSSHSICKLKKMPVCLCYTYEILNVYSLPTSLFGDSHYCHMDAMLGNYFLCDTYTVW